MVNSVDPDQMSHFTVSDLGLHCLPRPVSKHYGKCKLYKSWDLLFSYSNADYFFVIFHHRNFSMFFFILICQTVYLIIASFSFHLNSPYFKM